MMEASTDYLTLLQQAPAIQRFSAHSVISLDLISKIETDFLKRYGSDTHDCQKLPQLFAELRDCYKVVALIMEEIQSDLRLVNLQFLIEPFRKMTTFLMNSNNTILDAFGNTYSNLKQKILDEQRLRDTLKNVQGPESRVPHTLGVIDETEIQRLRKIQFQNKQKIEFLLSNDEEAGLDYQQQLDKILVNRDIINHRCKEGNTAAEIHVVKEKLEDILQFTEMIASQNSKMRTEQFGSLETYKSNRVAIDELSKKIMRSYQNAFKQKFVATVQRASRVIAAQIVESSRKVMVAQETQTYNLVGTKKYLQAEALLREVERRARQNQELLEEIDDLKLKICEYQETNATLSSQKKKADEMAAFFSRNSQAIGEEYAIYKSNSESTEKELKTLLFRKDEKISQLKDKLLKYQRDKGDGPSHVAVQCSVETDEAETQIQKSDEMGQINEDLMVRNLKEKHESLGRMNNLKEKRIKKLETYTSKLKNCLQTTYQQLEIKIGEEEELEDYIKKAEVIQKNEIRRRISVVAECIKRESLITIPFSTQTDSIEEDEEQQTQQCISSKTSKVLQETPVQIPGQREKPNKAQENRVYDIKKEDKEPHFQASDTKHDACVEARINADTTSASCQTSIKIPVDNILLGCEIQKKSRGVQVESTSTKPLLCEISSHIYNSHEGSITPYLNKMPNSIEDKKIHSQHRVSQTKNSSKMPRANQMSHPKTVSQGRLSVKQKRKQFRLEKVESFQNLPEFETFNLTSSDLKHRNLENVNLKIPKRKIHFQIPAHNIGQASPQSTADIGKYGQETQNVRLGSQVGYAKHPLFIVQKIKTSPEQQINIRQERLMLGIHRLFNKIKLRYQAEFQRISEEISEIKENYQQPDKKLSTLQNSVKVLYSHKNRSNHMQSDEIVSESDNSKKSTLHLSSKYDSNKIEQKEVVMSMSLGEIESFYAQLAIKRGSDPDTAKRCGYTLKEFMCYFNKYN